MRIGEKIKEAREKRGLSQLALAEAIGISQPAVMKIESGVTEKSRYLPEIAAFLGISLSSDVNDTTRNKLIHKTPQPSEMRYVDVELPAVTAMPLDVPVMGTAIGGNGGQFVYEGGIVDYVRRLPGIAKAKGVFALYVVGESMSPAHDEGDLIILNPHLPARIGDDVVVEFKPNEQDEHTQGCLKRLVKRTSSKIVVRQFNPPKEIEYESDKVKAVHRVMTMQELLGI